jgi:hypothetical protein
LLPPKAAPRCNDKVESAPCVDPELPMIHDFFASPAVTRVLTYSPTHLLIHHGSQSAFFFLDGQ